MHFQTLFTVSAASLAAFYFIRGAAKDFRQGSAPEAGTCGKCASGGCPASRKG